MIPVTFNVHANISEDFKPRIASLAEGKNGFFSLRLEEQDDLVAVFLSLDQLGELRDVINEAMVAHVKKHVRTAEVSNV